MSILVRQHCNIVCWRQISSEQESCSNRSARTTADVLFRRHRTEWTFLISIVQPAIQHRHERSWPNHQVSVFTVKICMLKNVWEKSAKVKYSELFFMLSSNRQTSINLPGCTLLPHLNLLIINIDYLKPGVVTNRTLFRQKDCYFYDEQQTCRRTQHNTSAWSVGPLATAFPLTDLPPGECSTPTNFPEWPSGNCYSILNSESTGPLQWKLKAPTLAT